MTMKWRLLEMIWKGEVNNVKVPKWTIIIVLIVNLVKM